MWLKCSTRFQPTDCCSYGKEIKLLYAVHTLWLSRLTFSLTNLTDGALCLNIFFSSINESSLGYCLQLNVKFPPLSYSWRPALRLSVLVKEKTYRLYTTSHVPKFLLTAARLTIHSYQNRLLACSSALSVGRRRFGLVQCDDFSPAKVQMTADVSSLVSPTVNPDF